jgi:hypothetical protein
LNAPGPEAYHVLPAETWHVVLCPRAAADRLCLARVGHQHHCQGESATEAPIEPPCTLVAVWSQTTARHVFRSVSTAEQAALLMHYATADRYLYLSPLTPRHGRAELFTAIAAPEVAG